MADFPLYTWNPTSGRYHSKRTGRFVDPAAVRRALDVALQNQVAKSRDLALQLRDGAIDLEAWELEMRRVVRSTQLFSSAAGRGGFAQMDAAAYGQVGRFTREQFGFLNNFTSQLQAGLPMDGRFLNRASLYAEAGRRIYHEAERDARSTAGFTEERNILHTADHCGPGDDSCPAQTDRGWVEIGDLVAIGARQCGNRCRCSLEYRKGEAVAVAEQTLTEAGILARPASAYPPARPGERETLNAYTTADGQLTPERQQLHDAIVRQHFQDARPVADPTVYVMGGGPASGKSAMLGKLDTPSNVVTIDPDHIKKLLPEYGEATARGDANAATIVHEESSLIAKRIAAEAANGRYQIVMDGTGDNSYENLAKKVAGYRAGGGKIVANYVTVDTETAVARAIERAQRPGPSFNRYVPETFIREVHRNISDIIPRAVNEGLFDELTVWDNNGAAGSATVIARYTGGQLTVLDEDLWQRFLAKATPDALAGPISGAVRLPAAGTVTSPGGVEALGNAVNKLAPRFGVDPATVNIVDIEPRRFKVGKVEFSEGGHFSPATGEIELNARILTQSQQAEWITAHEMTHAKWQQVRAAHSSERDGVQALIHGPEYDDFYKANGFLKPEKADEFERRFPATRLLGRFGLDSYGATEPDSGLATKLAEKDGVTSYSRAYWEAPNIQFDIQVNETLAEISGAKSSGSAMDRKLDPLWARLFNAVLAF